MNVRENRLEKEWPKYKLVDIIDEVISGSLPKFEGQIKGDAPVIKVGDIIHQKSPFIYRGKTLLDAQNLPNKKMAKWGDLLFIHQSSQRVVGRTFLYIGDEKSMVGSGIWLIKHQHNPQYLLHVFNSAYVKKQISLIVHKQNDHRGLVGLKFQDIKNILIPLPTPEIQEEVAKALNDLLTNELKLSDSLEKMMEIRKKQYEYYKEQILTSEIDKWDIRTIEEIAIEIYCGNKVTKEQLGTGDWPAIKCGDINSKLGIYFKECVSFINPNLVKRKKYFEYGDLLVSGVGSDKTTAGLAAAYLGKQPGVLGGMVYVVRHKQNPSFFAYMMSSHFCRKQIELRSCGGSVFNFFIKDLKKIKIPLPPLEQQEQIVSILEKLDNQMTKLNKDIQELTSARQQQCQYLTDTTIN